MSARTKLARLDLYNKNLTKLPWPKLYMSSTWNDKLKRFYQVKLKLGFQQLADDYL